MLMQLLLMGIILSPILCAVFLGLSSLFLRFKEEEKIANCMRGTLAFYLVCCVSMVFVWLLTGAHDVTIVYGHFLYCFIDLKTLVLLLLVAMLSNVTVVYSRRYLHRDPS